MKSDLQKKVDFALFLIRTASESLNGEPIEIAYSGGKDSDVILQLAKESGVNFRAIYKNTTIDPPGTIKHVLQNKVEIIKPKLTFFQLIERKGFPSRLRRFCCEELKEYKILDKVVIGVRRAESVKRANRYKEPTHCRTYSKNEKVEQIYPILEWSNDDLLEFINDRCLNLHPLYYNEIGKIDVNRRLGCIGCPLASEKIRIAQFKKYPNLIKAYLKAYQKYYEIHKENAYIQQYRDIYEIFYRNVFYNPRLTFEEEINTLFGRLDCKQFLEDFFKIDL